jgi:predicted nucleotidyltransferase
MKDRYKEPIEMFVDDALKKYGSVIDDIILFGSVATGHDKKDSDIDILVITHENDFRIEKDLIGTAFDILLKTGKDISVKVIQRRDYENMVKMNASFIRNIRSDGVKIG